MNQIFMQGFNRNKLAFPLGTWDIAALVYVSDTMEGSLRQLGFVEMLTLHYLGAYYAN